MHRSGPCLTPAPDGWGPGREEAGRNATRRVLDFFGKKTLADARDVDALAFQWSVADSGDPDFPGWWRDRELFPEAAGAYYNAGTTHVREFLVGTTSKDGTAAFYGATPRFRRADIQQTGRGDAAATTWIFRGQVPGQAGHGPLSLRVDEDARKRPS